MARKKKNVEDGMHDDGCYEEPSKQIKSYLDCPTCPYCGSATGLGPTQHPLGDRSLLCAACGKDWIGTPEQIAQANCADRAWDLRQDAAKGPRMAYVRRRARRKTDQLGLFTDAPTDAWKKEGMEEPT